MSTNGRPRASPLLAVSDLTLKIGAAPADRRQRGRLLGSRSGEIVGIVGESGSGKTLRRAP
jgi:ABC-type glutathione transport system ATPase component